MKPRLFLETDPDRKRQLQMRLTAQLPEWFGQPASNARYAEQAEVLDGYVAEVNRDPCGLLLLKRTSVISAEIYWMAVTPARHRQGLGRALVGAAFQAAREGGAKYLFVGTLHPDDPYEPYKRTREFYQAMGFAYVLEEQFPADPNNPIAYYMKQTQLFRAIEQHSAAPASRACALALSPRMHRLAGAAKAPGSRRTRSLTRSSSARGASLAHEPARPDRVTGLPARRAALAARSVVPSSPGPPNRFDGQLRDTRSDALTAEFYNGVLDLRTDLRPAPRNRLRFSIQS